MPEHIGADQRVLDGLRVVDWTRTPAAIRATSLLADYGADVVWIEPAADDSTPSLHPVSRAVFARNKRSIALEPQTPQGRDELGALLAGADVFVTDREPSALEELGLDYAALHARLPALVQCALSAFGPSADPLAQRLPAFETLIHAYVGTMGEQPGYREPPIFEGLPFAGLGMAYLAQIGILAALYRRNLDGIGRLVDTSMLDGALSFLSMMWGHADSDDIEAPLPAGAGRLLSRVLMCSDGEYIGVHTGAAGAFGRLIVEVGLEDRVPPMIGQGDIGVPLTAEQRQILDTEIPQIFLRRDRETWLDRLRIADVCAMPALRPTEVFDEPQVRHNRMTVIVDDPALGPVEQVAGPMRFGAGDALLPDPRPAPLQGSTTVAAALADRPPARSKAPQPSPRTGAPEPLLRGIKVLDFGVWYASAYSSRLLADFGADVVKVEPLVGDQIRGIRRPLQSAHSRKRSFAVDLKHPEMTAIVPRLLAWADVVHHNMRPGAAERLGVGYEQARAANPDVVYIHAPGWGTSGPDMARQSFAPLVSGYVGASYEVAGQFNPPTYPVGNEDPGAGMAGAIGILMALVRGGGAYIECPQVNAAMNQVSHIVRGSDGEPLNVSTLDPLQRRTGPTDGLYETADGWICIVAATPAQRAALGAATGVEIGGGEAEATIADRLEAVFAGATTASWLERLEHAGVPALRPITTNNNRAFVFDPQNRRTRRVSEAVSATFGPLRQLDSLIRTTDSAIPPYRPAPELGEHTAELLAELGCTPAHIAALAAAGAIRLGDALPSTAATQA